MDLLSPAIQDRTMVKIERALSFSGGSADMDSLMLPKKMRTPRDQMSHRIIEKRRRDRMNNCLANLGQLIPVNYLKQGQGRIEKTEIIEMATQHIQQLQGQVQAMSSMERPCCQEKFLMGYKECRDEVMRFLVEMAGYEAADPFCLTLLKHLHNQSKKFVPESASSVYQSPHSSSLGGEFTMPQNAGEVGGLMRLSERSTDNTSSSSSSLTAVSSSKPSVSSPVLTPAPSTWQTPSNVSPQQKNIYTDVSHNLSGPRMTTSCSPLYSDSGYSTPSAQHCANNKPQQSPLITVPSPPGNSSGIGIGGTPSSSSPETMQPEPESGTSGGSRSMRSQQAYKFKNDIKQRFTSHSVSGSVSFDKTQEGEQSSETTSPPKVPNVAEVVENPIQQQQQQPQKQDSKQGGPSTATPLIDFTSWSSSMSEAAPSTWNTVDNSSPKRAKTMAAQQSSTVTPSAAVPSTRVPQDNGSEKQVPAFALHPMGTCYIPLVIPTSVIEPFLRAHSTPRDICHPVSIPVNFNRPDPVMLLAKPEGSSRQQKVECPSECSNDVASGGLKRSYDNRD